MSRTSLYQVRIISASRSQHPTSPDLRNKRIYWLNCKESATGQLPDFQGSVIPWLSERFKHPTSLSLCLCLSWCQPHIHKCPVSNCWMHDQGNRMCSHCTLLWRKKKKHGLMQIFKVYPNFYNLDSRFCYFSIFWEPQELDKTPDVLDHGNILWY